MFDWFIDSSHIAKLKILALSPHTDDFELGAGGLIARLIEAGAQISAIAFSTCNERVGADYPDDILEIESAASAEILGFQDASFLTIFNYPVDKLANYRGELLDYLVKMRQSKSPDIVICPCGADIHQDHQVIHDEAVRAFKNTTILGYQMPWNLMGASSSGGITGQSNQVVVRLTQAHLDTKIAALSAYQSQSKRAYMKSDYLWSWARSNGVLVGAEFAEVFELIRWVV